MIDDIIGFMEYEGRLMNVQPINTSPAQERAMLPIIEPEIRLHWFDTGYEHGNLEQTAISESDQILQRAYETGYNLGTKHRQERHALRRTVRQSAEN